MTNYAWEGRNSRGELMSGEVEADQPDAVAEQLMKLDITPIRIESQRNDGVPSVNLREQLGLDKPQLNDIVLFSRQMHTLTKAGVPLIQGLRNVANSTRNKRLVSAIGDIVEALESGRSLSAGLARNTDVFPAMYTSIIQVGETSGALEESFAQMATYLELEREFRKKLKQALRYPVMVIIAMAIAMAILMVFVVPVFAGFFERYDAELPLPTQIIMAVSNFSVNYWWMILVGLFIAIMAARAWVRTERGRYLWDRTKLRLPVIGKILFQGTMARFARSFSMTYKSGVPLIQGLTLVSRAVENSFVGQAVRDMRTGIERGESISRTAQATGLFSPLVLQMISVGEETGDVDGMLIETAEYYEREVEYDLGKLSEYIEPILLVFLAVLVLIMALGVFLPMWDIGRAALG
ncbi:MAG: type II secretion system F family protein [Wenzhouxiangella sp.]|jgi:MSHA biogenesis protein MshG|nr:type II secretion system F family protein [Wenzhouxiangella sp.]